MNGVYEFDPDAKNSREREPAPFLFGLNVYNRIKLRACLVQSSVFNVILIVFAYYACTKTIKPIQNQIKKPL